VETGARGIIICQNPIGEHDFAKTFLGQKFDSIRCALDLSFSMLVLIDPHAAFQALHGSYQTRYDYFFSTNAPVYTDPLVTIADAIFKKMYEKVASAPVFTLFADGSAFASLTGERVIAANPALDSDHSLSAF
jgi:hypothetical protein